MSDVSIDQILGAFDEIVRDQAMDREEQCGNRIPECDNQATGEVHSSGPCSHGGRIYYCGPHFEDTLRVFTQNETVFCGCCQRSDSTLTAVRLTYAARFR